MWKQFKYSDKVRVAWVPSEGPCYQVMEDGEIKQGFRAFNPENMTEVCDKTNFFHLIISEDVDKYPELKLAGEPTFELTFEEVLGLLESHVCDTALATRLETFADLYHVEVPCSN